MSQLQSQLESIDISSHNFTTPSKRIHNQQDVDYFLTSPAYKLITTFILHLNASVSPLDHSTNALRNPAHYTLVSETIDVSPPSRISLTSSTPSTASSRKHPRPWPPPLRQCRLPKMA